MGMWQSVSTTLNLETAEDKREEKSIIERRWWVEQRGKFQPPWGTGESTSYSADGPEVGFVQDRPHLSRGCLVCGACDMFQATLATLSVEGICVSPIMRKQETPASTDLQFFKGMSLFLEGRRAGKRYT